MVCCRGLARVVLEVPSPERVWGRRKPVVDAPAAPVSTGSGVGLIVGSGGVGSSMLKTQTRM
jgi:hypothetical protein